MACDLRTSGTALHLSACRHRRGLVTRPDKIDMAYTKRSSKLEQTDQRWIPLSTLEIAQILLCKSRYFSELFLRESLLAAKSREIAADQLAHIHAQRLARHTS
jgi:hypothetical protein